MLNRITDKFLGFRTVKQIGFIVLIKKDKSLIEKWVNMIKNNYIKLSKNYKLWIKKEPLHLFPRWLPHFALLRTVTKCFAFHICKPVFVDILLLFLATLTRIGQDRIKTQRSFNLYSLVTKNAEYIKILYFYFILTNSISMNPF